jgi:hypothetical protein
VGGGSLRVVMHHLCVANMGMRWKICVVGGDGEARKVVVCWW